MKVKLVNRDGLHEVTILADEYGMLYVRDGDVIQDLDILGGIKGKAITGSIVRAEELSD